MADSWLHYWKLAQIENALESGRITHVASQQYSKVEKGDRIWVVHVNAAGRLFTIGYMDAGKRLTRSQVAALVDYEPWQAEWHFLAGRGKAVETRMVDLHHLAPRLRFVSGRSPSLAIVDNRVDVQQLRTIRKLTQESAALIEFSWGEPKPLRPTDPVLKEFEEGRALDKRVETRVRAEQAFIRKQFFHGRDDGVCTLCGAALPIDLLVAAHVKRRADCTEQERLDYANNVVPMCKLGCDDLFERGYVGVVAGKVRSRADASQFSTLNERVRALVGREVPMRTKKSSGYFDWHARKHGFIKR